MNAKKVLSDTNSLKNRYIISDKTSMNNGKTM